MILNWTRFKLCSFLLLRSNAFFHPFKRTSIRNKTINSWRHRTDLRCNDLFSSFLRNHSVPFWCHCQKFQSKMMEYIKIEFCLELAWFAKFILEWVKKFNLFSFMTWKCLYSVSNKLNLVITRFPRDLWLSSFNPFFCCCLQFSCDMWKLEESHYLQLLLAYQLWINEFHVKLSYVINLNKNFAFFLPQATLTYHIKIGENNKNNCSNRFVITKNRISPRGYYSNDISS